MFRTAYLILAVVASASAVEVPRSPIVSYQWSGGRSPFSEAQVAIDSEGVVKVTAVRHSEQPVHYETKLNEHEKAALMLAVDAANLFKVEIDNSSPLRTHSGRTKLTVAVGEQRRTVEFAWQEDFQPIQSFLWKLVVQADLFTAASDGDRTYNILGAVKPSMASAKVLQPSVFTPIIIQSLGGHTEFAQLSWRLQALTCLLTPEEFAGVVSEHLPKADTDEWRFWLTALSTAECYNNLGREHLHALFPLFQSQIRKHALPKPDISLPEEEAFRRFRKLFEEHGYKALTMPNKAVDSTR